MNKLFNSRAKYKVGCLFAAIGGFAHAYKQAGATIAWANEKMTLLQLHLRKFPKC
ncbi:MAG: hypothetical protein IPP55_04715 [Anaerolineales bacterium]|nr:hypothetical protein [Anaerolineales bacterium]